MLININNIQPHPNNPRHDLGDLTELTDSIRASGILQPPTIMRHPTEDDIFYTIIGHRRIAAAVAAGLTQIECYVLSNGIDPLTQMSTALQENIHRQNLKPSEETHAIQMMLDLGDSVKDIATKTGISENKVRTRKKVAALKLDAKKLDDAHERGARLDDFLRLTEIDDENERNQVAEKIGTPNFAMALSTALSRQESKKEYAKFLQRLKTEFRGGEVTGDTSNLKHMTRFYFEGEKEADKRFPKDTAEVVYYYKIDDYGGVSFYRDYTEDECREMEVHNEKRERESAIENSLRSLTKAACECRDSFVVGFKNAKKNADIIVPLMVNALIDGRNVYNFKYGFDKYGGATDNNYKNLLTAWYTLANVSEWNGYHSGTKWTANERLDALYDALISLGYEMSDDEKALRDGTHELFTADRGDAGNGG